MSEQAAIAPAPRTKEQIDLDWSKLAQMAGDALFRLEAYKIQSLQLINEMQQSKAAEPAAEEPKLESV